VRVDAEHVRRDDVLPAVILEIARHPIALPAIARSGTSAEDGAKSVSII
jgi:hypothetical protein